MPTLPPSLQQLLRSLDLGETLPPNAEQWQALLAALAQQEGDTAFTPLFQLDDAGIVTQWAESSVATFGYGPEMLGQPADLLLPSPLERLRFAVLRQEIMAQAKPSELEVSFKRADGRLCLLNCRLSPQFSPATQSSRSPQGTASKSTGLLISANLSHTSDEALFLGGTRFYEALLNTLPAPIAIFDPQLRYVFCNPASIRSPEVREWIIGKNDSEFVAHRGHDPEIAERRHLFLQQAVKERRTVHFEEVMSTPAGDTVHQLRSLTPMFAPSGSLLLVVGHGMDITALKRSQEALTHLNNELEGRVKARTAELEEVTRQLKHDALHDVLTGLPNRSFFIDRLEEAIARSAANPQHLYAVLFLDTDRFKGVNDTLGHPTGDALLCELAARLRRVLRGSDIVSRFGGDEFAVLLEPLDGPEQASLVAERLQNELRRPMQLDGYDVSITASIGVVLGDSTYDTAMALLRDADIAMYRAKAAGRAQSQVFTQQMRRETVAMNLLENELRGALLRGELRVVYQSIIDLREMRVTGLEALVRWQHPERGLLAPEAFLPVAEESGLLLEIDRWMLRRACAEVQAWQEAHPAGGALELSVNFSGPHFALPSLPDWLAQTLRETRFDPRRLNLEITEGVLLASPQTIGATLSSLREMGVSLHLDDFGTGYSSLSYLQTYPIDTLKIDRSFVGGMLEQSGSAELVRTIVAIAKNMKLRIIAEGIETPEQLHALRELGCEYAQGYLFSPPFELPADAIPAGLALPLSLRPNSR